MSKRCFLKHLGLLFFLKQRNKEAVKHNAGPTCSSQPTAKTSSKMEVVKLSETLNITCGQGRLSARQTRKSRASIKIHAEYKYDGLDKHLAEQRWVMETERWEDTQMGRNLWTVYEQQADQQTEGRDTP